MKIFAIIVTYNAMRRSWIEKCLKSLEVSTIPVIPVVVDNGSTDETTAYVTIHYPDAVCLPQHKNLGFGQANNVGLSYALSHEANYVLLLNQDATIGSYAIATMLPHCDDSSLLSPLHLNGNGNALDAGCRYALYHNETPILDDFLVNKQLADIYYGPKMPAACWLMSVGLVKKIGGFNPLFFHYGEDENYFHRLAYHHIALKLCPLASICHDRNIHGNMTAFNRHLCRRLMLTVATDINFSFSQRFWEWCRILKNCYTTLLPQKLYRPGGFFASSLWLVWHAKKIRESRKAEVKQGLTWLNMNEK